MVFNKLRRPKYTYQLFNLENIDRVEMTDTGDMINFIAEENSRLMFAEEQGSVIVAKLNRKGEIFVAQKIVLPMTEETDFDELLSNFYSKKYIAFDEAMFDEVVHSITNDDAVDLTISEKTLVEPEMPEDMKALVAANNVRESQTTAKHQGQPNAEMVELMAAFKQQQATIEDLKQTLKERDSRPNKPTVNEGQSEISVVVEPVATIVVDEPESSDEESPTSNLQVDTMIVEVKQAVSKRLSDYAKREQAKIDVEMVALDQRHKIPGQVKAVYEDKEVDAIHQATQQNMIKKDNDIAEENKRHEATLAQINAIAKQRLATETETIKAATKQRISQAVEAAYATQTKQLDQVLEGKLNELQLGQSKLNQALQANFENALATFNADHQKVMAVIEDKKTNANILPLNEHYQKAT
ncbi:MULTISPECIES: hypothetical protein [Leuconostoc]|mgnify:CR=1 FL=1|uniref:Uncharacterized protein n=1 Tax=Leuconostoc inhae TaxID=178001 RepID=A0AAN2UG24_9LACO|nr:MULTISPECIES: hypothetical protein [Leuconostoc]MBZ5947830.1 hypothetical protein [Leuconostoc gasicomitatum]MBZ5955682.1 hypothetical protein [Leuconostoc gasicomitatum]MBZ5960700.1 hypothetical protein [Leuconostoc gasicomitatum]MBZ5979920.1 hypothetical protein [Leuconostoc gasicomitatum]MBZ5983296.1 hypothetical protein [Leuconostoc gasicomitatum]